MNHQTDQLVWKKSTRSSDGAGQCVEVAATAGAVFVRDSKDPNGPQLAFGSDAWASFLAVVKAGELDAR